MKEEKKSEAGVGEDAESGRESVNPVDKVDGVDNSYHCHATEYHCRNDAQPFDAEHSLEVAHQRAGPVNDKQADQYLDSEFEPGRDVQNVIHCADV